MGCERLGKGSTPKQYRFQCLVSLMLSSQTKDQMTAKAMGELQKFGLTPESIAAAPIPVIDKMIQCVGFHNRKSEYLKKTAAILIEKYGSDIPPTLEEIMELPGVGPKMGHLCMQIAWGKTVGIGVDVHVHRIVDRLGWTRGCRTPEDTRKMLEEWMPQDHWRPLNALLVGFGQTVCRPVAPQCERCLLSTGSLCPTAFKHIKGTKRKQELMQLAQQLDETAAMKVEEPPSKLGKKSPYFS
jgi:endonuclease-3